MTVWNILRIPLLLVSASVAIYIVIATEPTAVKQAFSSEEMMQVYDSRNWLAGALLLLLLTVLFQLALATTMKISTCTLKTNKEKTAVKKTWAFELPLTMVFQVIGLLTFLYIAYSTSDWMPFNTTRSMGGEFAILQFFSIALALILSIRADQGINRRPSTKRNTP